MVEVVQAVPVMNMAGRQLMETPQDVAEMLRLQASGDRDQDDCSRDGLFEEHGKAVSERRRLGCVPAADSQERAGWAGGMACRAIAATLGQRRRGAPGSRTRAQDFGVVADGGAGGGAVSTSTASVRSGDDSI